MALCTDMPGCIPQCIDDFSELRVRRQLTRFFYSDDAYHLVQGDGQACDDDIRRVLKTVLGLTLRGPGLVSPNNPFILFHFYEGFP